MAGDYKSKQQSFMHGSMILVIATAMVKVIGALFRIPLANLLGETGMGFYSTAYDLYLPMYSLAMAGMPVAISRIIAEHVAAERFKDVGQTFRVAKKAFMFTGTIGFVLMCALAYPFVIYTKNVGALPAVFCIAPCLLVCCVMSAYRGYYEGMKNMTPTAVSQVIEALGKLVLGYSIAYLIIKIRGDLGTTTLSYAAAGALGGIALGSAVSALYLIIKYKREGNPFTTEQLNSADAPLSSRQTLKNLTVIAIPIVLGSFVTYITSLIDVVMVQRLISKAIVESPEVFNDMYADFIAYKQSVATGDGTTFALTDLSNALYGCHRGYAYSIYNLVPVITSVLGVSAIPILASAWTQGDNKSVKANIETVMRTTALVSMPAGIGIFAVAGPILNILYSSDYAVAIATPNLRVLGIAAVFAGITIPMASVLQAIGKQKIPVRNVAIGAVIKIVVNYAFVSIPTVNIKGVPIGTACCYVYICVANIIAIIKYSKVKINLFSVIGKPFLAAALCGLTAFAITTFIGDSKLISIAAIGVAGVVYIAAIGALKAIEKEDVLSLPKGEKIARLLEKIKIIR